MDDASTAQHATAEHHAGAVSGLDAAGGRPANVAGRPGTTGAPDARLPERTGSARARALAGKQRDLAAAARDRAADARDVQAQARDELSDQLREIAHTARVASGRDVIVRAAIDRERAFEDRALAAEHRAQAALDREHATRDRLLSMRDRAAAIAEQQPADTLDVSGVLAGAAGLAALAREVDRAYRTDSALIVIYVNAGIDAATDDADDATRSDVAGALLGAMRSYDVVIDIAADAFVCALCGATIVAALERFAALERTLAASGIRIAVGYSELAAGDTPGTLIDAAAADVPSTRPPADQRQHTLARSLDAVPENADGRQR